MWSGAHYYDTAPEPGRLVGHRTCGNCGRILLDHCELHWWPCCPGECPGPPRPPGGRHGGGRPPKEAS